MYTRFLLGARGAAIAAVLLVAGMLAPLSARAQSKGLPFPLRVPAGFQIELVSNRLRGARFLAVAPNGDVIVSQVSRGQVVAVHPGSPADSPPMLVADGLERPNGLAFRGTDLYIATWSGVVVVPGYPRGIGSPRTLFSDMPHNADHNNRALALAPDGSIFISSGCQDCVPTTMNMQAHSAPLQSVFYNDTQFPAHYRGALFIAFQGSWNRQPPTGYKIVAVTFADGKPTGIEDFVTGWLTDAYKVYGHPIGAAVAADGSLYACDDTGNLFRVKHSG